MKHVDVKSKLKHVLTQAKKLMMKIVSLKLVMLLEYQNVKAYSYKVTFQIGLRRFLWLKKLKTLCRGHVLLVILKAKKLLERFTEQNCKKQIKKEFRVGKVIKRKFDKLYVKQKGYDNSFYSWVNKREPKSFVRIVKVVLGLLYSTAKADLKNARGIDTLKRLI